MFKMLQSADANWLGTQSNFANGLRFIQAHPEVEWLGVRNITSATLYRAAG